MTRLLTALAALLWIGAAHAQTKIFPPPIVGQAVMSATTTSAAINSANVTLSPGSSGFPPGNLPNSYLRIKVLASQTGTVAVCWFGGTCSGTTGEVIAVGEAVQKGISWNIATQPPTIIALTGTVIVEVEW